MSSDRHGTATSRPAASALRWRPDAPRGRGRARQCPGGVGGWLCGSRVSAPQMPDGAVTTRECREWSTASGWAEWPTRRRFPAGAPVCHHARIGATVHGGGLAVRSVNCGGSVRQSGCRRPWSRVGGSIVRRPPRVAGGALDRSITHGKSRGWPRTPKRINGAAADPTSTHCSGQMGCCHAECPGHRRTL